ncbi:MAG: flagellar biosynthesis protein FlhA [Candidatus Eremiobacterota bacterium]
MKSIVKKIANIDVFVVILLFFIIALIIIKLPVHIMDTLLVLITSISIVFFIFSLFIKNPLDYPVLPTLILLVTLTRSTLNIAAMRLILLDGHRGVEGVGHIITMAGKMIVGGNVIAGFIVLPVITAVNFLFITAIIERIYQVGARFTIDATPSRGYMSYELTNGLLDPETARLKRKQVEREADFYGAMDGTGKFIKAEALLLVIITLTGIVGGMIIGMLRYGMTAIEAVNLYTSLSVGNGFLLTFSAFLMSTATGLITGRAASDSNLGFDIIRHIAGNPETLLVSGSIMFVLYELMVTKIINFPSFPFLFLAVTSKILWWVIRKYHNEIEDTIEEAEDNKKKEEKKDVLIEPPVEMISMEIGRALLPFIDPNYGAILMKSVDSMRRFIALETGVTVPSIRFRDNLSISPESYIIKIKGVDVTGGKVMADKYLAFGHEKTLSLIKGIHVEDPVYNMPALWISRKDREYSSSLGCLVIDPVKVIISHMTDTIKKFSYSFIDRNSVIMLLEELKKSHPAVVKDVYPNVLTINEIEAVFKNLVKEHVSIRDTVTIFEAMGDYAHITKDPDVLTEYVRQGLCRQICRQYGGMERKIKVLTVDPDTEKTIEDGVVRTETASFINIDIEFGQHFISLVSEEVKNLKEKGIEPVIITSPSIRTYVKRLTQKSCPGLAVLSYNELAPGVDVTALGMVRVTC